MKREKRKKEKVVWTKIRRGRKEARSMLNEGRRQEKRRRV
jgi:hypothetical protein